MSSLHPVGWRELVRRLRVFGFFGPYQEGKHPFMVRGTQRLTIPNPHDRDVSVSLLARLLRQAGISKDEWGR